MSRTYEALIKAQKERQRYLEGAKVFDPKPQPNTCIPLLSTQDPNPSWVEAYRTLLTNIRFFQTSKPVKILLITSSGPQEGKSTIAANLGILLAQEGSKVLLVDADLRKPILHEVFNVNQSPGLTDLLLQVSSTQITKGHLKNFSVGDAFQLLKAQKKTGILRVVQKETTVSLFFKDGELKEAHWKNLPEIKDLGEIFRIKDGTFQFQETTSLDDFDISDNGWADDSFKKAIPQVYRQPFIESRVAHYLKPTHIENLKVLSSGRLPPDPSQLLRSQSMKIVLSLLRKKFDAVIFDSPPAGSLADASVLSSIADATILVIRAGFYDEKLIQSATEGLEMTESNICGVALNQVDSKSNGYHYGKYGNGHRQSL